MRRELTASNEDLVCAVLVSQLWCIALSRLKFDCHLCIVEEVRALKDDAEGAFTARVLAEAGRPPTGFRDVPNLLADAVVYTDDI